MLPQRLSKTVFAGTTTITFAAINFVKLFPYWQLGQLDLANLKISVLLMPIAVAGTFCRGVAGAGDSAAHVLRAGSRCIVCAVDQAGGRCCLLNGCLLRTNA